MDEQIVRVEESTKLVEDVVNSLVSTYCADLDDFMGLIRSILRDPASIVTDDELESMVLVLPNLIYFASDSVESLGLRGDMAKAIRLDAYNAIHKAASGTVADKRAQAESGSQEEALVQACYESAYKKIKNKIEAAYEQLNAIKKVIDRRRLELQINYTSCGGK